MFPDYSKVHMLIGNEEVDYLIGVNKASWQPVREVKARGGGDLWLWRNQFGACIGGTHPLIRKGSVQTFQINKAVRDSLMIPTCMRSTYLTNEVREESISAMDNFFKLESLGTNINPKCGACRCGKCPVPRSRYSH